MCRDLPRIKYGKSADVTTTGDKVVKRDEEYFKVEQMNNEILARIRKSKADKIAQAKGVSSGSEEINLNALLQTGEVSAITPK
jgi:predicted  nucleic acid-binding Zn-ribbon protein